jgi:hypothetical protein
MELFVFGFSEQGDGFAGVMHRGDHPREVLGGRRQVLR